MEGRIQSVDTLSRILALDYGEKRIGIALSDPMQLFAKPYCVIENAGFKPVLSKVMEFIEEHEVGLVVVGLPYSENGEHSSKTIETETFTDKLRASLTVPVLAWDERFSTREANEYLKQLGYSWQEAKKHIDAMAACMILKSYLESKP